MTFLEQNVSVIKKLRPDLYIGLQNILKEKHIFNNIKEVNTRDGNKALIIEKNNKEFRMNSLYKPLNEAGKWADQYEFHNNNTLVIMFGLGNGLFVREMLKRLQKDAKVYLYEPGVDVFLYVLHYVDIVDIIQDKSVCFFINGINDKEFDILLKEDINIVTLSVQIVCNHPVYDNVFSDEFNSFLTVISNANKIAKVNNDTEKYMSSTLVNNIIRNIIYIRKSNYISEFIGKIPEDVPAIIVAAGPSLDKNIDELKKAEGKAFILATDTSVKYLLSHGINIDAVITLDPKKSMKHFEDVRCYNIPLFCVLEAKNEFMDKHKGRKIWFRGSVYMYDLYSKFNKKFPDYNSGGSVATAAFSTCVFMKFKNIIFVGQDLAYNGEVTHAGGIVKDILSGIGNKKLVQGIDGEKIWTRYDWLIYLEWFEEFIKKSKELNVIDATEGGALIHGTKVMRLCDAINEYCKEEFSFNKLLEKTPFTFSDNEYNKVAVKILNLGKEFVNIKQKAIEGIEIAERLLNSFNNLSGNNKDLKNFDKINKFITRQDAYSILDVYITNIISDDIQMVNKSSEDSGDSIKKKMRIAIILYRALIKSVDELMPVLNETLKKISFKTDGDML